MRELGTGKENTWCVGCGNFGILNAVKKAIPILVDGGIPLQEMVITCGIGCHGKIFDYLSLSGIYGLHGRGVATTSGIKLANPKLQVISFGGDGDSLGEGLEHTLFAAKRNMDITLILHNNGTYGLTTGQFSPLSGHGYKGLSTPYGSIETPFRPIPLLMEAGATFLARGFSAKPEHLAELIVKAVRHKGFSFIEVMQPCISYNNTYTILNDKAKMLEAIPQTRALALELATDPNFVYLGTFLQQNKPCYHEELFGDINPLDDRFNAAERNAMIGYSHGKKEA